MGPRQRILAAALTAGTTLCALLAALALLLSAPARALASGTEQSVLMDDDELIYSGPAHMIRRLHELASLGVDRVKVSVVWSLVAPNSDSTHRPRFDATNPAAYPPGAWDRYDTLVRTAHSLGMGVYFQISPPAPLWALPGHQAVQGPPLGRAPVRSQLRQFVEAVGRRYSGSYVVAAPASDPPPSSTSPLVPLLAADGTRVSAAQLRSSARAYHAAARAADSTAQPIPRVAMWGIWNEPNERSWLNPWYRNLGHGRTAYVQPAEYRGIVDAAWSGLAASGHAGDTVLVGETANRGMVSAVGFQLALYCVDSTYRPLSGQAARSWGCSPRPDPATFVRAHPGLFQMTGYAHHPYVLDAPPTQRSPYPDAISLADLGQAERRMNRIFAAYGVYRAGGVPLYMTEWGYKTNPPNPYARTSLANQAAWLNEGEYMSWKDPHVQMLAQFELVDSPPKPDTQPGSYLYWSSFQTGLILRSGRHKPAYDAFRIPIWLPSARHGSRVTVWGQLRPADHSTLQYGLIEFRPRGGQWQGLRVVQTASPEGFILAHIAIPSAGSVRLVWLNQATSAEYTSRTVSVR